MTEVHRYKVVQMVSETGGWIGYDPHGPEVVMASAYDQLKTVNETLQKDAERYRWLISKISRSQYYFLGAELTSNTEAGVDAAIDAAMIKDTPR